MGHCTNCHENLSTMMWLCIIIRTCVCDKEKTEFNSNFLPVSKYIFLFSSLTICLSCLHLKEFQPTYAYEKRVYFQEIYLTII